jgi:hypothetical protein
MKWRSVSLRKTLSDIRFLGGAFDAHYRGPRDVSPTLDQYLHNDKRADRIGEAAE